MPVSTCIIPTHCFPSVPLLLIHNDSSQVPCSASRSQNAGVENAEALPNPWGAGGAATGNAAGAAQGAQGEH